MFLRSSFSILSLLMFSSSSSAVYRGIFSQTCYPYISRGSPRYGAQGVCINDCAAIYMAGKPSTLMRGDGRNQDGGCTGGINGQTPCKVGASVFGAPGTSCDEYPYASTREGAASGNPSILRCIPAEENSSGGQQLTQFYTRQGVQPGDTFGVGFVWGQPIYNNAGIQTGTNPPVPAVAAQMRYAHPTQRVNDGREFRMVLTTQLWRRATSVFRRKTAELQEITAERKSTVAEPLWVKTANNLTMMVYSDVKLGSPIWSDGEDRKDKVVRIIKPSDSDYPPKQSTKKATGNESGGMESKNNTGGKSTKTAGSARQ